MISIKHNKGFTLMELLVTMGIFSVLALASTMLLLSGQRAWYQTDTRLQLLENSLLSQQKIAGELQESGKDENDVWQVFISDGAGINNSDILRFSIPICLCGMAPLDENGDVHAWGAPLIWGQAGCTDKYPLEQNGKVKICHIPPGNPDNEHTINVSVNAVKAHLAHGDRLGDCNACDPTNYSNRFIEYRLDNDGQLLRRVLDSSLNEINSIVVAQHFVDIQATLTQATQTVALTFNLATGAKQYESLNLTRTINVTLRNVN